MGTQNSESSKEIYSMVSEEMGNVCKVDNDNSDDKSSKINKEVQIDNSTMDFPTDNDTGLQATHEKINNDPSILEKKCDHSRSLQTGSTIISEYLSGNYQQFFEVWDRSFSSDIKESVEYKVMTLKLRVHYAILPIRVAQLNQHIDYRLRSSQHVNTIFDIAANKYILADNEEVLEDENSQFYTDSMKQLEKFLNSCDGRKLTEELKDSPLITFFALPYLDSPQEDESVKKIFTIDWLEELTSDLAKFVNQLFKDEDLATDSGLKRCDVNERSENSAIETVLTVIDHKSKLTETEGELISCNRIIHSAIKNKEIEDWITNYHQVDQHDNSLCTKSTQTRISSLKTGIGFSMISEPHHFASLVTPSVFAIPSKQSVLYNDELNTTKTRLFSVHKHYRKLKLRFHKLHEDYQKMNEIAEVLTIALESSVQGKSVNLDMILQSCSTILPNRLNRMELQTDSEDTGTDVKELSKSIASSNQKENNDIVGSLKMLDYEKIKLHLRSGDIKTKLLLLVALRQKLTSTQLENRNLVIRSYVENDLLGFKDGSLSNDEDTILNYILMPINSDALVSYVQQTAARFLNALASLNSGRKYLTLGPIVLNAIIKYLDSCTNGIGDAVTLDMLVATLQKMSLRRDQRNFMVEANLVEWLIYHLSNENFRMGTYRLEYTCALLMNLSLQSAARSRAAVIAPFFVSILTSLLSSDCVSILPYVNGALQNFLMNNEINEEAKKLHLAEILEYYCVKSGEELRNHFIHTLKVHKREYDTNLSDDEFPDEDDEIFDVLEKELEEDDPVKFEKEELQGDNLLNSHYSLYISESQKVTGTKECSATSTQTDNLSLHKESKSVVASETNSNSSTPDDPVRTETRAADKKSSTDTVRVHKKVAASINNDLRSKDNEDESAFHAKPKIQRTPPSTARVQTSHEKIAKRVQSKIK